MFFSCVPELPYSEAPPHHVAGYLSPGSSAHRRSESTRPHKSSSLFFLPRLRHRNARSLRSAAGRCRRRRPALRNTLTIFKLYIQICSLITNISMRSQFSPSSQLTPLNCGGQKQAQDAACTEQLPPFTQGDDLQLSGTAGGRELIKRLLHTISGRRLPSALWNADELKQQTHLTFVSLIYSVVFWYLSTRTITCPRGPHKVSGA